MTTTQRGHFSSRIKRFNCSYVEFVWRLISWSKSSQKDLFIKYFLEVIFWSFSNIIIKIVCNIFLLFVKINSRNHLDYPSISRINLQKLMPVEIPLEPNEQLIYQDSFQGKRQTIPFVFAASKSAIFVSKEKHFAKESWCFVRIPLTEIKRVFLRKERPMVLWATGTLIFVFGLALCIGLIMAENSPYSETRHYTALPLLITIFGIALPFLAKNRRTLIVEMVKGKYKWKPRMQFDKKKREQIEKLQENILETCQSIGVKVNKDSDFVL